MWFLLYNYRQFCNFIPVSQVIKTRRTTDQTSLKRVRRAGGCEEYIALHWTLESFVM